MAPRSNCNSDAILKNSRNRPRCYLLLSLLPHFAKHSQPYRYYFRCENKHLHDSSEREHSAKYLKLALATDCSPTFSSKKRRTDERKECFRSSSAPHDGHLRGQR